MEVQLSVEYKHEAGKRSQRADRSVMELLFYDFGVLVEELFEVFDAGD